MRILIYRLGSLGDAIVSLPCFHLIAKSFKQANRIVLTNYSLSHNIITLQQILEATNLVHGYLRYPLFTRNPKILLNLQARIFSEKFNTLIYLTAPRGNLTLIRDYIFFKLCGIRKIIGVPFKKDLRMHYFYKKAELFEHEASRLARCIKDLGDVKLNNLSSWDLQFKNKEQYKADYILKKWSGRNKFISCCPGTKMPSKDWGIINWKKLIRILSCKYNKMGLIFIGSSDEYKRCEELKKSWKGPAKNLCGLLSARESAAVIGKSSYFIGHDSGPMHLAVAVGVPCLAIFSGRNRPGIWFPYEINKRHKVIYHKTECSGCYLEVCNQKIKLCMESISTDEVIEAVEDLEKENNIF